MKNIAAQRAAFVRMTLGQISQICSSDATSSQCQAAATKVKAQLIQYQQQGSAAAMQYAQNLGVDQNTASQLSIINYAQLATDLSGGVSAVTSGASVSNKQIQSAMTTAAATAAVIGGASLGTAVVAAGIGAAFYAGAIALGNEVQKLLGILDGSPLNCSSQDTSYHSTGPSDPKWKTFSQFIASGNPGYWTPYSSGAFENWARPTLIQMISMELNCKTMPGVCGDGQLLVGLVAVWNSMFPAGTPTRAITFIEDDWTAQGYGSNNKIPSLAQYAQQNDPIQIALRTLRTGVNWGLCQTPGDAGTLTITVADPPIGSVGVGASTPVQVAAVGIVGGLAAGAGYMWYAGTLGAFVKKAIGIFR